MAYHVSYQTLLRSPTPSRDSHKISSIFFHQSPSGISFFFYLSIFSFPNPLLPPLFLSLPHLPIHTSRSQWLSESFTVFLYVLFLIINLTDLFDGLYPFGCLASVTLDSWLIGVTRTGERSYHRRPRRCQVQ
jgi:hypothetical protein